MTPLRDIIQAQYLHKADTPEGYTLSSGEKTDHYYDIKAMMGDRKHIEMVCDALSVKVFDNPGIQFRSIGGTELGGIPLATALQIFEYGITPVCFIRKSARIHGMKRMIEGVPVSPILLIDDVFSSGQTIIDAHSTCVAEGFKVSACLVVVNRMENIQRENLEKFMGFKIYSLFDDRDFGF
jgi:orotate phosphoribosyltransferase